MKYKRRIVRSSSKGKGQRPPPPSTCRALILMDSTVLRRQEQDKCQKLYRKLETTRTQIELHENESAPEFQKWTHSNWGEQLTEIRELNRKVLELRDLVETVENQSMITDNAPWKVYETIMQFRSRAEDVEKQRETWEKARDQVDPHDSDDDESVNRARAKAEQAKRSYQKAKADFEEDVLRTTFESMYGSRKAWRSRKQTYDEAFEEFKQRSDNDGYDDQDDDYDNVDPHHRQANSSYNGSRYGGSDDDGDNDGNDGPNNDKGRHDHHRHNDHNQHDRFHSTENDPHRTETSNSDTAARIKEQYRRLAKKLHPDLNPGLEPRKLALWHQVQEAYDANDLAKLETLAALGDLFDHSWDGVDGISTLRSLFKELKTALTQFERKLRLARQDRSWKFNEKLKDPDKLAALRKEISADLREDQRGLSTELRQLQTIIDSWSKPQKRKKRSRQASMDDLWGFASDFEMV